MRSRRPEHWWTTPGCRWCQRASAAGRSRATWPASWSGSAAICWLSSTHWSHGHRQRTCERLSAPRWLARWCKLGCRRRTDGCADRDARSTVQCSSSAVYRRYSSGASIRNPAGHRKVATVCWIADRWMWLVASYWSRMTESTPAQRPTGQDRSQVAAAECHGRHSRTPPTSPEAQAEWPGVCRRLPERRGNNERVTEERKESRRFLGLRT